jgi:hypothetical protein
MSFVHPIALMIGAGLLAAPLAIHLLTRPRPVRFPFSAIRFLESALRQRRFFARLRDALVLVLRMLLLVALAGAFARPLLSGSASEAARGISQQVIVLDVSRSMGARRGGVRVFDRARAQALRHITHHGDTRIDLILAGARPRAVFDALSTNYPALEAEARGAEVVEEALDARAALARATQLLDASPAQGRGQIVIVSDLQQTNWRQALGPELVSRQDLVVEYVGLGADAGNLAVTGVSTVGNPEAGSPTSMQVEVNNFSGSTQLRTVQLVANDRSFRQEVEMPAFQRAAAVFEVPADVVGEQTGGWVMGSARIVEARDVLASDDARHFAFRLKNAPRSVLISREDPRQVGSSSYFLSRMLCPGAVRHEGPAETVVHLRPDAVTGVALEGADLLVLNKPGLLKPQAMELLAGLLMRGRPVLYFVAEPADAENLSALKEACGAALALPVEFAAYQVRRDRPGAAERSSAGGASGDVGLTLQDVRSSQEPFREFGDGLGRLLQGLAVWSVLKTMPDPAGVPDDVLARWSDGSAALVCTGVANGRLAIWNADLAQSSLPRSPFFVACVRQLAVMLLTDRLALEGALPVGQACAMALPSEAGAGAGLEFRDPDGHPLEGLDLEEGSGGVTWRWPAAGPPGVYRLVRAGRTAFAVATDCPAVESDLRPMDSDALRQSLAVQAESGQEASRVILRGMAGVTERTEAVEVWPWVLVAGLVLVLAELGTLKAFRV